MMLTQLDTAQAHCFMLDGYPRTIDQAKSLDFHLAKEHSPINFVINLQVSWGQLRLIIDIILDRIENRWIHAPSGRTYNLKFNPPKLHGLDDITKEPLVKRPDDCPESFKTRLQEYSEETMPLIEYYEKRGVLHNFAGNSSNEITPLVFDELERFYSQEPDLKYTKQY